MTPEVVTIGVYGWLEELFFRALVEATVDTFCDIRARRGVRGSEYTFANSRRLQARLADLGIRYIHRKDLAPSPAARAGQQFADSATRTPKRLRATLGPAFVDAYRRERLSGFDSAAFVAELGPQAQVVALFCVEREPSACHRSLLAERLVQDLGIRVTHMTPRR